MCWRKSGKRLDLDTRLVRARALSVIWFDASQTDNHRSHTCDPRSYLNLKLLFGDNWNSQLWVQLLTVHQADYSKLRLDSFDDLYGTPPRDLDDDASASAAQHAESPEIPMAPQVSPVPTAQSVRSRSARGIPSNQSNTHSSNLPETITIDDNNMSSRSSPTPTVAGKQSSSSSSLARSRSVLP